MVPGQFVAGQFVADNLSRTIRRKIKYKFHRISCFHFRNILFVNPASISGNIRFINPASIQQHNYFQYSSFQFATLVSSIPLPFQEIVISTLPLTFQKHIFITPASMSATLVSSIPLSFQETFFTSLPLPFRQHIFITPAGVFTKH